MHIRKATPADYPEIMRVWESSVLATHHFLLLTDFQLFKNIIPTQMLPVLDLYVISEDRITGVLGVSGENLEMLFIDAASRGKGYGKALVEFALKELHVKKVDVNEQNEQAVGFYLKSGFVQTGRSERDGMGKPYPLLHMEYNPYAF
ncbi:GNAT family N-acetyltransferase [Chitinophaga sp.]|uniref:GNAT family N-acetyltransferase n=1 Tax=Chitinophaga sp. TaxID=1869181 RepID=UPI002606D2AA|nr:GNAT family N-acetyltransferase [uncultured Chitinophaga sp.]